MAEDRRAAQQAVHDRCLNLVTEGHLGQGDKAHRSHVGHLLDVSGRAAPYGDVATLARLLHDLLEETETTLDDIRALDVPDDVVEAVTAVTRRPDDSYEQFIERIIQQAAWR